METALRSYLEALSPKQLKKMERDSIAALRLAWPARNDLRGRATVKTNIIMIRNLRSL